MQGGRVDGELAPLKAQWEKRMPAAYLFVADNDFKLFFSELIAQQHCPDGTHHVYSFSPESQATWDLYPWASRTMLPWVHKNGHSVVQKYWHLRTRLHEILAAFEPACAGADQIVLHMYQIYSERTNYLINHLRKRFPRVPLHVRLIPDGVRNLKIRRMTGIRSLAAPVNRLKWAFDSRLNYYGYSGDRLGSDAEVVDRIYLPRGFPHMYTNDKVCWVDMPQAETDRQPAETALVLGTALLQRGMCSASDMDLAAKCIREELSARGVKEVWYKPHHAECEQRLELWSPGYRLLTSQLGVERLLTQYSVGHLVGQCSTALLTARLMHPQLKVISCGLDVVERRAGRGAGVQNFRSGAESLGIQLVPALPRRIAS
jgi:hypothetical protein